MRGGGGDGAEPPRGQEERQPQEPAQEPRAGLHLAELVDIGDEPQVVAARHGLGEAREDGAEAEMEVGLVQQDDLRSPLAAPAHEGLERLGLPRGRRPRVDARGVQEHRVHPPPPQRPRQGDRAVPDGAGMAGPEADRRYDPHRTAGREASAARTSTTTSTPAARSVSITADSVAAS